MKVNYLVKDESASFEIKHLIFTSSLAILTNGKKGNQIFVKDLSRFLLQHNNIRFQLDPKIIAIDLINPDFSIEYNKELFVIHKCEKLKYRVDSVDVNYNFITLNISDFMSYCNLTNKLDEWDISYINGRELDWVIIDMESYNLTIELWN